VQSLLSGRDRQGKTNPKDARAFELVKTAHEFRTGVLHYSPTAASRGTDRVAV